MKKTLASLLLTGLFLTACGGAATKPSVSTKPSDQILDNNIFTEATNGGNLTRCKDILDATLKASCEQVINDQKATNEAIANLDKSKCSKVSDERYKNDCETQIDAKLETKKVEEKIAAQKAADGKNSQNATDSDDPTKCDLVSTESGKYTCKFNIITKQAMKDSNPSLCDQIGDKDLVAECKAASSKK